MRWILKIMILLFISFNISITQNRIKLPPMEPPKLSCEITYDSLNNEFLSHVGISGENRSLKFISNLSIIQLLRDLSNDNNYKEYCNTIILDLHNIDKIYRIGSKNDHDFQIVFSLGKKNFLTVVEYYKIISKSFEENCFPFLEIILNPNFPELRNR